MTERINEDVIQRTHDSWSRSDPIGLAGGIKLYRYVENSLSWIDPFGLTSISYAEEAKALGYESVNNQCSHGSAYIQEGT